MKKSKIEEHPILISAVLIIVLLLVFLVLMATTNLDADIGGLFLDLLGGLINLLFKIGLIIYLIWSSYNIIKNKKKISDLESKIEELKK